VDTGLRRVASLDVVRGLAILGTLASNIWIFTSIGSDPEALLGRVSGGTWTFDRVVQSLTGLLVDGRFLALLSIVFGVGMAILFETAARREQRWPLRYWWRCLILLLDGLLHYLLVVEFDVLMGYAVISAVVAPVLLLSRRWIVVAALVAGLVHLGAETYRVVGFSRFAGSRRGGPGAPARRPEGRAVPGGHERRLVPGRRWSSGSTSSGRPAWRPSSSCRRSLPR
jgi:uncharacterized protein